MEKVAVKFANNQSKEVRAYLLKNIKCRKTDFDEWEAWFVCADGYRYSIVSAATGRVAKSILVESLIKLIMSQEDHRVA